MLGGGLSPEAVSELVSASIEASKPQLFHVEQRQAATVNSLRTTGAADSSGGWDQIQLTTVVTNEVDGASLASNAVTLPAGDYEVDGVVLACQGRGIRARLFNQTAGATLLADDGNPMLSTSGWAGDQAGTSQQNTQMTFKGKFTLVSTSTVVLQQATNAIASPAYGKASNEDSLVNVYCQLLFYKLP